MKKLKVNPYRLLMVLLFMTSSVCAQTKLEKEYRLRVEEVPANAVSYVESFQFKNKVKWYYERNETTSSIEAKTKTDAGKYSIEFSKDGVLEDIEVETDFEAIPKLTQEAISKYLKENFRRHRIRKTQTQYLGDPNQIKNRLVFDEKGGSYTINYELILKGKDATGVHLYEFLFSEEGKFLTKAEIIFSSTNNLEY